MPDDMTGLEQSEGKIIVDARGTVRRVSFPEPEAEEKALEAKGAVRDLAEKAATAVAGGLVAEAFDAIQDAAERARVSGEIHRWDKEYKKDPFGNLTYGELRVVLATGRHGGKKLAPEEAEAARNSRQTRYREAASYGVMTGVEGKLRTRLVDAEWGDYPAQIAEAARIAEIEAMGRNEYRHNPRIQGVVSDAVSSTELLVRRDGYRGLTDLNNPKNVEKLRQLKIADINKEMEALEARIANEVLWDPEGGKYAGLVNQETLRQKEERLEKEKITAQQQHELDLVRAKAAAEAAAKGKSEIRDDSVELLGKVLEQMSNREVRIVEDEINDWTQYDQGFLKAHGLPSHIYIPVGIELHRRDMRTALALASNIGEFTGLSPENFIRGLIEDEKDKVRSNRSLRNGERVELSREVLERITVQGQEAFKEFVEGIIPMIVVRKKDGGTFSSLVGQKEPKPSASPEQVRGALGVANFDLKMTAQAYLRDPVAMDILGTWLAIRGRDVPGLSAEGRNFANKYVNTVKGWNSMNDTRLTRNEALERMEEITAAMRRVFDVLPGQVTDMQELSNLLVPGPEMQEWRTKREKGKNEVLWGENFRYRLLGRRGGEELAYAPVIEKVVYPEDEKETQLRQKKRPKFLSSGLESHGVGGRDGLFDRIARLNSGTVFQYQYQQMRNLVDGMDAVNEYLEGNDSFPDAATRRVELAKLVDNWCVGETSMVTRDTVEAIKRLPEYAGKGKNAMAGKPSFFQKEKSTLVEVKNDVLDIIKSFIGITPLGLIIRLGRRLRSGRK